MNINEAVLEVYFSLQDEDIRGEWIKGTDNMCRHIRPPDQPKKRRKKTTLKTAIAELLMANDDEAFTIMSDLEEKGRVYTVIPQDGDCMFRAILSCIKHPLPYDVQMFHRQIVAFASHNMHWFCGKLITENESLESYLHNVSAGLTYGDSNILQIVAMMWKIRISILNPYEPPDHIWHAEGLEGAHVILC